MGIFMAQLIRNYQDGGKIVLTEQLRRNASAGSEQGDTAFQISQQAERMMAEASATLAQARSQAAALLQQAEEDALVLQAEAQARGFAEGYEQGMVEGQALGQQMLAAEVEKVQAVLASIQGERTHLILNAEREVASLSLAIGERIVGKIGREDRDIVLRTVNRALHELTVTGPFLLRIHPSDAVHFNQFWQGVDSNGEPYVWKLALDANIEPGGCVLVYGPSTVDARLSTQLKAIVHGLALTDYRLDRETDEPATEEPQHKTPAQ